MAVNPLNASYCAGDGIGVDSMGRPQWRLTAAGQAVGWTGTHLGKFGGTPFVATNVSLPITNTTARTRAVVVDIAQEYVDVNVIPPNQAGPFVQWRYYPPGGSVLTIHWASFEFVTGRFKVPGVAKTIFLNVPAASTATVGADVLALASQAGVYDLIAHPITITANWLGE